MDSEETKIIVKGLSDFTEETRKEFRSFILATWLKGNYYGNYFFRQMPKDLYFHNYGAIVENVLIHADVRIACASDNPTWLVGYSILNYNSSILYWVHVKRDFREKGIAKLLLAGAEIEEVKGTSKIGRSISENKGLIFNPL